MAVIKMNFLSRSLGVQTNVTICLPSFSFADIMNGRDEVYVPGMKYQVLWLLHGGSGDDSDYLNFSNITRYADNNKIAVVMPSDYNMSYEDNEYGNFMTFIAEELPKMCRAIFPFSDKREDNFIGGLSMGSGGCQKIAMRYPEQYAAVLAMSGGAFAIETPAHKLNTGMPMPPHKEGVTEENRELAIKNVQEGKLLPKIFMTWGDKDFVREGQIESTKFLRDVGYDVFDEEVPGYGHEWDFWDLTLRKALNEWLPIRHGVIYPGEE
jgi:S-formylglutathione hydrolase FrmB